MTARSKRQREILNFLTEFLEIKGYSPSYKEIADGLGLSSKGSVARHIETLEAQGFLDRIRDENGFTLRLKSDSSGGCRHFPIGWHREPLGDESPKQAPALTSDALGPFEPERLSAFEIEDDSLSGDGIKEGDIVFVELRSLATEGEIVLAKIEDEHLVRRYQRTGSTVTLTCSNERFDDLSFPFSKVSVVGIVRGLLRPLT
jgi:repressor LexA